MSQIPRRETLTCEFKSDRKYLPDRDLVEAAACMANGRGGDIFLGVEDDGEATGVHPDRHPLEVMATLIAARTHPQLLVTVTAIQVQQARVARICVPASSTPVATSDGVLRRRRLKPNGEPECVNFLPHDYASEAAGFGLADSVSRPGVEL